MAAVCFLKSEVAIYRPWIEIPLSKFGMPISIDLPKCQTWPNQKPEVDLRRSSCHLLKLIWRHNSVGDHPICMKFDRAVQYYIPMTLKMSKSKSGIEFKYGGCLFSASGSNNISAVDWDIQSKFGTQIVLCETS